MVNSKNWKFLRQMKPISNSFFGKSSLFLPFQQKTTDLNQYFKDLY